MLESSGKLFKARLFRHARHSQCSGVLVLIIKRLCSCRNKTKQKQFFSRCFSHHGRSCLPCSIDATHAALIRRKKRRLFCKNTFLPTDSPSETSPSSRPLPSPPTLVRSKSPAVCLLGKGEYPLRSSQTGCARVWSSAPIGSL